MNVIVDANIVFSAILNTDSVIGQFLTTASPFSFIAPAFLQHEINLHHDKLMKVSKLPMDSLLAIEHQIYKRIKFMPEDIVTTENWQAAVELTWDIDFKDMVYVAYALQNDCYLWTGDKRLVRGLLSKNYRKVITTEGMVTLRQVIV